MDPPQEPRGFVPRDADGAWAYEPAWIKAQTRVDPSIGEAFSFLGDALRSDREAQKEDTEEPEPAVG